MGRWETASPMRENMKRIIFIALLIVSFFVMPVFADRNTSTIKGFSASTLVKRGDWKIYRISFVATADAGSFTIYDSLTSEESSDTNVKTEGSSEKTGGGHPLDFADKPLEGSTGLYLVVVGTNVVIEYE